MLEPDLNKKISNQAELDQRLFISPSTVIESMRDNGYKNTAYAIAELIDNSIQAQAKQVYFVVYEKPNPNGRGTSIHEIAIIDNGIGMSPQVLNSALEFGASYNKLDPRGLGKFGMGLPNSSISQCKRTDVYSWQNGELPYTTYLDIDQITLNKQEFIAKPVQQALPHHIALVFEGTPPASGTAVIWQNLDRLHWKTANSLLRNTQDLIGRMYRRMIDQDDVKVTFKNYQHAEASLFSSSYELIETTDFKANDPMYLINETTLKSVNQYPTDLLDKPAFTKQEERKITIKLNNGKEGDVVIRSSVISDELREKLRKQTTGFIGSTGVGVALKNNIGLSIMRANRELELIENFKLFDDKRKDRWMGVEIEFSPVLDEFFGVTNNKQAATKIRSIDMDILKKHYGCQYEEEVIRLIDEENPEDAQLIKCLNTIESVFVNTYKGKVEHLALEGLRHQEIPNHRPTTDRINTTATEKQKIRSKTKTAASDITSATQQSVESTLKELVNEGKLSEEIAKNIVQEVLENGLKVLFKEAPLNRDIFFDVRQNDGFTLILLNPNHNFYKHLVAKADPEQQDLLKMSLAAWGRMEAEAMTEKRRADYVMTRENWGQVLSEYLNLDDE